MAIHLLGQDVKGVQYLNDNCGIDPINPNCETDHPDLRAWHAIFDSGWTSTFALGVRETILLVDDEEFVRKSIREALESAGYSVLVAAGAAEAKQVHGSHPTTVDLLLADVVMPGMTGQELADDLATSHPELRVLLMSGYAQQLTSGGLLAYQREYMAKPFWIATLLRRVRETLDRRRGDSGDTA
jgi:CheY-like chemotaxis protein